MPNRIGMSELNGRSQRYLRKVFWNLPKKDRDEVMNLVERHFMVCKKWELKPDKEIFYEVICDARLKAFGWGK